MARRKIYFGSLGPFIYDDEDLINDQDGDFPGLTRKAIATDGDFFGDFGRLTGLKVALSNLTGDYTVDADDDMILFIDTTAGDVTVTLPTVVDVGGRIYSVKKVDSSANKVIIMPHGTETIEDELKQELVNEGDSPLMAADGVSNWGFI